MYTAQSKVRLPAEWESQSAVMLTWPHAETDWSDFLPETEQTFCEIARHILQYQTLIIVCRNNRVEQRVRRLLDHTGAQMASLITVQAASNDSWARDHGPITTLSGENHPILNDLQFNGWGGKYPAVLDNAITQTLIQNGCFGETEHRPVQLVLEGGAVESDGCGTFLGTRSSVITETRNPGLSQTQIEQRLAEILGFHRFLWLDHGQLTGDDTDGHIDTLVRFADPETLLYVSAYSDDPDASELKAMEEQLKTLLSVSDTPYRLLPLPPVTPILDADGRRLSASYANFLIINEAVLLPVYQDANDTAAANVLQQAFPDRQIIPIDCRTLIRQNGSLHCLTMQFPAAVVLSNPNNHTV